MGLDNRHKLKLAKRLAVLISNGKFSDPNLPNLVGPQIDNQRLNTILSDINLGNFEVTSLVDQGLLAVRKAIAQACATADINDTLLIYYSGTSFLSQDGGLCLSIEDTDGQFPDATLIEAEYILAQLRNSRCHRIVLLVDGCHSGAFFEKNRGIPDGMFAITSCSSSELSYDTPEGGAFTRTIIEGLIAGRADKDGDGKVSVDDLYNFVQEYVSKTDYETHPQK